MDLGCVQLNGSVPKGAFGSLLCFPDQLPSARLPPTVLHHRLSFISSRERQTSRAWIVFSRVEGYGLI
jgi:hypothetical protein